MSVKLSYRIGIRPKDSTKIKRVFRKSLIYKNNESSGTPQITITRIISITKIDNSNSLGNELNVKGS